MRSKKNKACFSGTSHTQDIKLFLFLISCWSSYFKQLSKSVLRVSSYLLFMPLSSIWSQSSIHRKKWKAMRFCTDCQKRMRGVWLEILVISTAAHFCFYPFLFPAIVSSLSLDWSHSRMCAIKPHLAIEMRAGFVHCEKSDMKIEEDTFHLHSLI